MSERGAKLRNLSNEPLVVTRIKHVNTPAQTMEHTGDTPIPKGTTGTIAVTVRLDPDRYRRLVSYGARFVPRRTNQEILIAALDEYLGKVE
jgi:hypothetical protein